MLRKAKKLASPDSGAGRRGFDMAEVKTEPKRLLDLNPTWDKIEGYEGKYLTWDCPCGEKCRWARIPIPITNPIDGSDPVGACHWERIGEDFASISLKPSIHHRGHWHGFLTNGMVISC